MTPINRALVDPMMDDIDHALGRPAQPLAETYRDHFALDASSNQAIAKLRSSPFSNEGRSSDQVVFFHVSEAGRRALHDHLKALEETEAPKKTGRDLIETIDAIRMLDVDWPDDFNKKVEDWREEVES